MTTEIVLRFPWGRYHGTPWGRHVNEGSVDWPPSPWRLLRALYATWQFRAPELEASVVEALLGKLAQPPSYDLPPFTTAATRHYLPGKDDRTGAPQRDLAVDAFVVIAPDAAVRMRWDLELSPDDRHVLAHLLRRLTYLGRAESLCDASLAEKAEQSALPIRPLPQHSGDDAIDLLLPATPLDLDALTVSTTQVRAVDRRRLPAGARSIRYTRPAPAVPVVRRRAPQIEPAEAVRWSFAGRARPSRHAAVALTTRLRQRAMGSVGAGDYPVPPVVHGKSVTGDDGLPLSDHGHAHWLAFGDRDTRLLRTVVTWAPNGFHADVLARLARVDSVRPGGIPDFGPQRLGLEGWGSIGEIAPELVGPSRVWSSFTPFAPCLHRKKEPTDQAYLLVAVRRELEWRDLPIPVSVVIDQGPWRAYRTHRPDKERLRDSRRAWGLRLVFEEDVVGPLALGALSHFGLGLFLPER